MFYYEFASSERDTWQLLNSFPEEPAHFPKNFQGFWKVLMNYVDLAVSTLNQTENYRLWHDGAMEHAKGIQMISFLLKSLPESLGYSKRCNMM